MAWFLFIGDMLVMLFMTVLVVWIYVRDRTSSLDYTAQIPLQDDNPRTERKGHG